MLVCNWSVGVKVSLNLPQYSVTEGDSTLSVNIEMNRMASKDIPVQITVSDDSTQGIYVV